MELLELALTNFKKFTELRLKFCPGINLVWGPNESGKSTLHEAICCALFGRERGKVIENWSGGHCRTELTFKGPGNVYHIQRGFTEGTLSFGTIAAGEITDLISKKDEVEKLIAMHTGIASRGVFDSTVSVKQTQMSKPEASDLQTVGSEIQRVLTGAGHSSAAEVLKKLEDARDDIKGRVRHANPRYYDRISDQLRKLAEDLADSRRTRRQVGDQEREIGELKERITVNSEKLAFLEEMLEKHNRWSELKRREAEIDALHKQVFSTVKKINQTIADLAKTRALLESYTAFVGKDEDIAEHLSQVKSKRDELEARLKELNIDTEDTQPSKRRSMPSLLAALFLAVSGLALGYRIDLWYLLLLVPAAFLAVRYMQFGISNWTGRSSRLVESAREGLKQLAAEEKNILSYINCKNADEATVKIRNYRDIMTQNRESEIALQTLLSGRKIDDWCEQESELSRDLSTVRRELGDEFPDYSPTTKEIESWRSEWSSLQSSLPTVSARLYKLEGSLDSDKKNLRDLASIEGEIDYLHIRKDELDFLHKAYEEAITTLGSVFHSVSEEYIPTLSEKAASYMENITSGRYNRVMISHDWEILVDCRDKTEVNTQSLSAGTADQLFMALRISCGELLSNGKKLPVILDDPFASFDQARLKNALALLESLASDMQMLLFTHDPQTLEWAKELSSKNNTICSVHTLDGC